MLTTRTTVLISAAVAAVTTLIVGVAGVALASHQWNDVSTGDFFHESIDNFTNAGCASGFNDGTFRGNDPVKRQQMARFVNSCGGRADFESGIVPSVTTSAQVVANGGMTSGAVGDGAGIMLVHAEFRASSSSTTGFPCEIKFTTGLGPGSSDIRYLDLPADTADGIEDASGSFETSFTLGAGFNSNFDLTVEEELGCTAAIYAEGSVTTTYFPFDRTGDGGSESGPETSPTQPSEQGRS